MLIAEPGAGAKPEKRGILVPVLLGCVWCVLAASLLSVMAMRYRARMAAVSLSENRFITTEWSLLQELKVQTDTKLMEKDQEIADLQRRYLNLSEKKASPDTLRQMEIRLEEADQEREELASGEGSGGVYAAGGSLESRLTPLVDPARLPELLTAQIRTLQAQLDERRLYARVLEEQLAKAQSESGSAAQARAGAEQARAGAEQARAAQAETQRTAQALQAELSQAYKAADAARTALQRRKEEASSTALGMEDLNTWMLLRAIVSSPAIREQYPDLLKSMEQYLQDYGRQERAKGGADAYSAALGIMESVGK